MGGVSTTPAEVFGPYEIFEKLGSGGMATVHRARKLGIAGFSREVALKRLLDHLAVDRSFVEAFVREAKLAVRLRHPNIAHIYELGKVGDTYFISMEYVEGHDLRDVLRKLAGERARMPISVVVAILLELCDALDYAHSRVDDLTGEPLGIVHRDISPSNLVITEGGHLKVIDFGIAKAAPRELATSSGRLKGKFGYMAPEVLRGKSADPRSDLFSVGVLAHELLSTRRLFGPNHSYETLRRIHREPIPPPSTCNPAVPSELDDVIMFALERDPNERYQSAEELRDALYAVGLLHHLDATSDQTAAYLDELMREPERVIEAYDDTGAEADEIQWISESDIDSVDESFVIALPPEEHTVVDDAIVGVPPRAWPRSVIDLPPADEGSIPEGIFGLARRASTESGAEDEPSRG